MKRFTLIFAALAAIISGCRDDSGIRGYWSSRTPDIENITAAEDEFADFALLAAQAPEKDAFAAVDMLLKKARTDEVTYLVYTDWIIRGFSSLASPCFSCPIFIHASKRILSQGIVGQYEADEIKRFREFCLHNHVGDKLELPPLVDGICSDTFCGKRTLFLVVDPFCPACRESMQPFLKPEWEGTRRVALCYGHGPLPEIEGWECHKICDDQTILDTRQAPFCFVAASDGTIELSYTRVNDEILF